MYRLAIKRTTKSEKRHKCRLWIQATRVHGRRSGTPRLSTMTHGTVPSRQASASQAEACRHGRLSVVCGLRIADADLQFDPRTDSERIFLFRGRDVAIAMNSIKILHAVRSAITATAELLVLFTN